MLTLDEARIGIIGLGYVGLPLAVEFGKHVPTVGFDINAGRVAELRAGNDFTLEVTGDELAEANHLTLSHEFEALQGCNIYIVTVPTPVDNHKQPDFSPLIGASRTVGSLLKNGDIVIYESTVYPGATEEICLPVLEQVSGLRCQLTDQPGLTDAENYFFLGYSPERINPCDKTHRLTTICKVTSGSTPEIATFVNDLYGRIISAGTHKASSIKVAEASKVIENTQRDVNIALMNELAQIFERVGIDTHDVLAAAGSKWNFLPFTPGLVGGHCIGVDPYYLAHKAMELGYQPSIIPSSRLLNDSMGEYVAGRVIRLMARNQVEVVGSRILILGLSFKENCPDLRNTRVIDIIEELNEYSTSLEVYDPWVDIEEAKHELGVTLTPTLAEGSYDAVILAVAHRQFIELGEEGLRRLGKEKSVIFDVKSVFDRDVVTDRL